MDDVIPVELVCCDNGMKDNILTTLNDSNVRFVGTTPQLYAPSPNRFMLATYMRCLFGKSSLECLPTGQFNLQILFFDL